MFPVAKFDELCSLVSIGVESQGLIKNTPENQAEYDAKILATTPEMTAKIGSGSLHEIHIFLEPIWAGDSKSIDYKVVDRYNQVVENFNRLMSGTHDDFKIMKNPLLALKFKKVGYVNVMQSSLYVLSNDRAQVIKMSHQLAHLFSLAGFTVIREKIEATAHGIIGIPESNDDAKKYGKYFEFHIRVQRKDATIIEPLMDEELEILEEISSRFETKFNTPVPLSFNRSKEGSEGGHQRYLNIRTRGLGSTESFKRVKEIHEAIDKETPFKVAKVISEYVWYDTFTALDSGWIDFEEETATEVEDSKEATD